MEETKLLVVLLADRLPESRGDDGVRKVVVASQRRRRRYPHLLLLPAGLGGYHGAVTTDLKSHSSDQADQSFAGDGFDSNDGEEDEVAGFDVMAAV
ncbi:hypothetical protein ACLOJK_040827 [Asimina triloba]